MRNGDKKENNCNKDAVYAYRREEAALATETMCLTKGDCDQRPNYNNESCESTRLLLDIVGREARDWNAIECVCVQGANPAAAQPQDSLVPVCIQIFKRVPDAEVIQHESHKCTRQESTERD